VSGRVLIIVILRSLWCRFHYNAHLESRLYRVVQKKIAQSSMNYRFATVCSRIMQFHQHSQELTGNTKNGQILITVIKYSLFESC